MTIAIQQALLVVAVIAVFVIVEVLVDWWMPDRKKDSDEPK